MTRALFAALLLVGCTRGPSTLPAPHMGALEYLDCEHSAHDAELKCAGSNVKPDAVLSISALCTQTALVEWERCKGDGR